MIPLQSVDRVRLTVLVDNLVDPLLVDQDAVWRLNWPRALRGVEPAADRLPRP